MTLGVESYRKKRMPAVEPFINGLKIVPCDIAVCIPCLDELEYLPSTIDSIINAWNFYNFSQKNTTAQPSDNFQNSKISKTAQNTTQFFQPAQKAQACKTAQNAQTFQIERKFSTLLIVVNVNNKKSASEKTKNNNFLLYNMLCNSPLANKKAQNCKSNFFNFENYKSHAWNCENYKNVKLVPIDCFSKNRELPEKDGAGFARKVALDFAFLCCDGKNDAILCCLDADTLIDENYFCCIAKSFGDCVKNGKVFQKIKAGVTDFCHQLGKNEEQNNAILQYEKYLKTHSENLQKCGSPWYPVALGPTLVCTAQFYASCGGMNRHIAGEDFYFLQAMLKTCGDGEFTKIPCTVRPSSRLSERVTFGTGTAIKGQMEKTKIVQGFAQSSFEELKTLLDFVNDFCFLASKNCDIKAEDFFEELKKKSENAYNFLQKENFLNIWEKLFIQNRKDEKKLKKTFNCWFDGLKTIQFFHFLEK